MYKTCMFCKGSLGSNEVVETFPVGRRLAFDAAKGRLWVVCRKCTRWNLTPLEERWEAIETCERIFQGTRMRTSTENIGIARHREGLELVRIGEPPRPEYAAWRYGDQFGRRMRRYTAYSAVVGAASLALVNLPGAVVLGGWCGIMALRTIRTSANVCIGQGVGGNRPATPRARGEVVKFRQFAIDAIRLLPANEEPGFVVQIRKGIRKAYFAGEDARRIAAVAVTKLNVQGGARSTVRDAVAEIESSGHPRRFLADVAMDDRHMNWRGFTGYVGAMPKPTRLALEMALHEEQERRALEGELWVLEQAWKEAEEIAAIADNLLLPSGTAAFFDKHGDGD